MYSLAIVPDFSDPENVGRGGVGETKRLRDRAASPQARQIAAANLRAPPQPDHTAVAALLPPSGKTTGGNTATRTVLIEPNGQLPALSPATRMATIQ